MDGWVPAFVVVATLAGMLTRPRGIGEAWSAMAGAAAMIAIGAVSLDAIPEELRRSADILLFLLGMMALTAVTERAGVFEHLAEWCARLSRGSGTLLFANVFMLGALVTTLLSLDVMIIVVTPIVYAIAMRRKLDPLPFMFACTFVANTGSMLLPISNLTNLLVFHEADISFVDFARALWFPAIVAVLANFLVFRVLFRDQLPRRLPQGIEDPLPPADGWYRLSVVALSLTLAGLFALGVLEQPLSIAALAGGAIMVIAGAVSGRAPVHEIRREVSWALFPFVIGMVLLVRGAEETFLSGLSAPLPDQVHLAALTSAGLSALGSNIVNNVPMTLLGLSVLERETGPTREPALYGMLVGVNIGPTLTTYGSLATMLWLTAVRRRGLQVTTMLYLRVGVVTMPIVLLATILALLVTL